MTLFIPSHKSKKSRPKRIYAEWRRRSAIWLDSVKHPGVYQQFQRPPWSMHARQNHPTMQPPLMCSPPLPPSSSLTFARVYVRIGDEGARTCPPSGVRNRVATLLARRRSVSPRIRTASRHSAPALGEEPHHDDDDDDGGGRETQGWRESPGSSRPYFCSAFVARSYWCTRYILPGVRPASRPVDARRP